jgi:hypothetical protein
MSTTLESLAPNCVQVRVGKKTILFSYQMPVALTSERDVGSDSYQIDHPPSRTTARHLAAYGPPRAMKVSAAGLAALLEAD